MFSPTAIMMNTSITTPVSTAGNAPKTGIVNMWPDQYGKVIASATAASGIAILPISGTLLHSGT